ncbi:hypothetical protein [Agromyces humi]|uniref:hypothetical protein n=1 Tax=Agromyces humi TaxID=1766800 RepID=UPI00135BCC5B|nr:hypothetical protein [Agromyces humi]
MEIPTRAIDDFDDILDAGDRLLEALRAFRAAEGEYGGAIKLTRAFSDAFLSVTMVELELSELRHAVKVVREGAPIARADDRGVIWKRPLTPREIALHAALADEGDTNYLAQLADVLETERQRAALINADLDVKRGRGNDCRNFRVYWPGRSHAEAPACWKHLAPEEAASLEQLYDRAIAGYACPGCIATPGEDCSQEASELKLIDGRWPRVKSFRGRRVHPARLDASVGG